MSYRVRSTRRCHTAAGKRDAGSGFPFAPEHAWKPPIHLTTTGFKGVSSMHPDRDLDITQKSAWHLAMRLRKAFEGSGEPVRFLEAEVDETYIGGLE